MDKGVKKKNPGAFRLFFQSAFFALTNSYVQGFINGKIYTGENKALCVPGLNCYSCPGALFACPIGSLQAVLNSRDFKISCYVFGFITVIGAFFGRLVCGFMCPFGLVQDLLNKIPLKKKLKNLPGHKYLKYLRYVVLAVFVLLLSGLVVNEAGTGKPWYCEYICPSGTLFGGIPLVAANESLQGTIGWRFWLKIAILGVILLLSVVTYRPFCKYLCPLGALYGVCNPIALYRYRVDEDKCVKCGACQKACGMGIKVWEKPNSTECIRCGECRVACPTGAITTTLQGFKSRFIKDLPEQAASAEAPPAGAPSGVTAAEAETASQAVTTAESGARPAFTDGAKGARTKREGKIAPDEKKSSLRALLGGIIAVVGLALTVAMGYLVIGTVASMFTGGLPVETSDIFHLLCVYGTTFSALGAALVMLRSGGMIIKNAGRYTASTRALRMLVIAVLLFVLTRVLNIFYQNTLTLLVGTYTWWTVPIVWLIIFLSCLAEKKKQNKNMGAK